MHFQRDNYVECFTQLSREIRLHWYSEIEDLGSCDIAIPSTESPGQKYQQYIAAVLNSKMGKMTHCGKYNPSLSEETSGALRNL